LPNDISTRNPAHLTGPAELLNSGSQTQLSYISPLAITTYSTIFNSSPKISQPQLIIFDDAHAGEQYVGEQYSVHVSRYDMPDIYFALLDSLSSLMNPFFLERLRSSEFGFSSSTDTRMLIPLRFPEIVNKIDDALMKLPIPRNFDFLMIRSLLPSCNVYISYSGVLIRPMIPPTFENGIFTGALQRIYLSATLGRSGELERSFGRSPIERLSLPEGSSAPRSGRRLFVFPDLITDADGLAVTKLIVKHAGKALVLSTDGDSAVQTATELAQPTWDVLTISAVRDGMKPFEDAKNAVCGLASRYDGLDLPGEVCRVVVLEGLPSQNNLQERFLSERARAGAMLAERIRSRIVQGAGRCTRGPNDFAIVVILGRDLSNYLLRNETRSSMEPELQAEISFGFKNSLGMSEAELMENIRVFLGQEEPWRDQAEPILAESRRISVRVPDPGADVLADSCRLEILACQSAAKSQWELASSYAFDAARTLGMGGESTRGLRAIWLYLSGVWQDQAAEEVKSRPMHLIAEDRIRDAGVAAFPCTWPKEQTSLPGSAEIMPSSCDGIAIEAIAQRLESGLNAAAVTRLIDNMNAGLSETEAVKYEPALTTLGELLGAQSKKSSQKGRCDSEWCWNEEYWLTLEAKSDQDPKGVVTLDDIRQANIHLKLLAADRGVDAIPEGSATIVVSPRLAVDPDGVIAAEKHVFLVHPQCVQEIAMDVERAWGRLLAAKVALSGVELRAHVRSVLEGDGVLPSDVAIKLTSQRIHS
jgi:hypothetical protein